MVKGLNVKPETKKLMEEDIGSQLLDISIGHDFLDMAPKAKATKAKANMWDSTQLKSFYTAKEKKKKRRSLSNES